ncbi:hypothetical protein GCM10010182_56730 [Actinomadura cremea]|nr:hypothetical protein GCM10010182_56730 [Actinomadura cremea]
MGNEYGVQRASLRDATRYIFDAALLWEEIASNLADAKLADGDLGIIGQETNTVARYNGGVDAVWQSVNEGVRNIMLMHAALDAVATTYGRADQESQNIIESIRKALK